MKVLVLSFFMIYAINLMANELDFYGGVVTYENDENNQIGLICTLRNQNGTCIKLQMVDTYFDKYLNKQVTRYTKEFDKKSAKELKQNIEDANAQYMSYFSANFFKDSVWVSDNISNYLKENAPYLNIPGLAAGIILDCIKNPFLLLQYAGDAVTSKEQYREIYAFLFDESSKGKIRTISFERYVVISTEEQIYDEMK